MAIMYALILVLGLVLFAWVGIQGLGLTYLFGVVFPYTAMVIFFLGVLARLLKWSRIPNPFSIPTTGGQQRSLHWIKPAGMDNPFTRGQSLLRLLSEVFLFRSLFRNLSLRLADQKPQLTFSSAKWLWLFAIFFPLCPVCNPLQTPSVLHESGTLAGEHGGDTGRVVGSGDSPDTGEWSDSTAGSDIAAGASALDSKIAIYLPF